MLKESILKHLNGKQYFPKTKEQIKKEMKIRDEGSFDLAFNELKDDYDLIVNKKGNVFSASKEGYSKGNVTGLLKNFIFIRLDGDKDDIRIKLHKPEKSTIRLNDRVLVKYAGREHQVKKIIKHNTSKIVAEYRQDIISGEKKGVFIPENKDYNVNFEVEEKDLNRLVDGHKVVLQLDETKSGTMASLLKILGHKNDPGVDIEAKIVEAEAPIEFSKEALDEAQDTPNEIKKEDFPNRLDLTNNQIFTIDGADAKDLDDGVECHKLDNGNFKLGVHIADVAHYVKEKSPLDNEAYQRGTSIYLADRVVPMYPHKLSNGICSLNPHVERLAMSCYMEIDKNGEIVESKIDESVINSKKRFTYDEVNEILEKDSTKIKEQNKQFLSNLKALQDLSHILRKNKEERGKLDLNTPESKAVIDEKGVPIDFKVRKMGEGEKIIEDCMIAANEAVATTIQRLQLPFLYRVHQEPDKEKIFEFNKIAKSMDINVKYHRSMPTNLYLKEIYEKCNDDIKKDVLSSLFVRGLPKAKYDNYNIGHFGLGSSCYTHFTSPIRRYPDTIVHRFLKKYLLNKEYLKEDYSEEKYQKFMEAIGESTSEQERRAQQLERDVDSMKKAEYMTSKIGEEFTGKISGFNKKGFYVQLPNTVEGMIGYKTLKDDKYYFDEESFSMKGRKSNKKFTIGMPVDVKVYKADKQKARIDFDAVRMPKIKRNKKSKR